MTKGDIVNQLSSVPDGSGVNFQPASGVEVIITSFTGNNNASTDIRFWDGTNGSIICLGNDDRSLIVKIGLTNALYMRMVNSSGAAVYMAFTGVQVK